MNAISARIENHARVPMILLCVAYLTSCETTSGSNSNISNEHPTGILKFDDDAQTVNPKTVDLTEEGSLDWVHWGFGAEEWTDSWQYTHKADVSPLIRMDTIIEMDTLTNDSPALAYWYGEPTGNNFKWNDGTPTRTENGLDAGVWMAGIGNGFRISVPAKTKRQFIKLYLGVWESKGNFTASLSDNSAPVLTSTYEKAGSDYSSLNVRQYTLEFSASSDNELLTIDWIVKEAYDADGWGNVTVRAVALSDKM